VRRYAQMLHISSAAFLLSLLLALAPPTRAAAISQAVVPGVHEDMLPAPFQLAEHWPREATNPLAASPVVSYTTMIPFHSQLDETPVGTWNACGPAALLMLLDFWELEDQLVPVIDRTQVIPPDLGGYDEECQSNPVCTSPGVLELVAEDYGMGVEARGGWTMEEVRASLVNGHPVIAAVTVDLDLTQRGHFVVIYGVDVGKQIVYYHDPYRGPDKYATWDEFSVSWGGPVDKGDPLQPAGHKFWGMSSYLTGLAYEWRE
jgi:hypothetical protein